ncbi:MAG: DNA-binding protein [Bacteroidales bacterium]|nr:MAG: DNA-binding protein [Bacteroidales bacterium]
MSKKNIPLHNYKYNCPKCGNKAYNMGELRAPGSFGAKLFNIQNLRFTTITCNRCFYTEMFKTKSSQMGNVVDFFFN